MNRLLAALYGALCYLMFLLTVLYAVGFVAALAVPKTIDSGAAPPWPQALLVDALLLAVFALQHSVMARPAFKRWWTRCVPTVVERSTYVLLSNLALILLFWQWQPLPAVVWDLRGTAAGTAVGVLAALGWLLAVLSTFMISHWDLFGLRQVWLHLRGAAYQAPEFVVRGLYRWVRHPIMLGFLLAFWAAPLMTAGHLLFAVATTLYILGALQLEERDLLAALGDAYRDYRARVPMLLPWRK